MKKGFKEGITLLNRPNLSLFGFSLLVFLSRLKFYSVIFSIPKQAFEIPPLALPGSA